MFVFKLNGLEEVYKQEGSHRGDELVKEMSDFISMNFKNIDILGVLIKMNLYVLLII